VHFRAKFVKIVDASCMQIARGINFSRVALKCARIAYVRPRLCAQLITHVIVIPRRIHSIPVDLGQGLNRNDSSTDRFAYLQTKIRCIRGINNAGFTRICNLCSSRTDSCKIKFTLQSLLLRDVHILHSQKREDYIYIYIYIYIILYVCYITKLYTILQQTTTNYCMSQTA